MRLQRFFSTGVSGLQGWADERHCELQGILVQLSKHNFGGPMRKSRPISVVMAVLFSVLVFMPRMAHAVDCHAGTLVTVVAHLDDDLLFVNPGITDKLDAGWCVKTVHLVGGANGANFSYVLTREAGAKLAYARMARVANDWIESTVNIGGRPVHQMTLKQQPRVTLLEFRLPGGAVRGGRVPLASLWDEGATLSTYPMNVDGSGRTRFDRSALVASLREILSSATEIYTLNPDTVPFIEHPDHIYVARMTRNVAEGLGNNLPISFHLTYVMGALPKNVSAEDTQRKRDSVASYFAVDGNDAGHVFGEYEWDGNWVGRRYWTTERSDAIGPDFQRKPVNLVNEYSSQCLTSGGGPGTAPRLAACTGAAMQNWDWQPLTGGPGYPHNAQLRNDATRQCVAERAGGLVEETCNPADFAQRWTPWDFGIVYTPLAHCLGSKNGAVVSISACASATAEYRWAPTPLSQWTDQRQEGAMYGDVRGAGTTSSVYVQRRKDGPGFDVWVADLSRNPNAATWYVNAVPFDSTAIGPTCSGDIICFDSVRFLLGDFEGDGKADLMVIAPRNGGTAFWLLHSTGTHFEAPRLWYQTTSAWTPRLAQQYVAADFTGTGRADVMIAQRRDEAGLNLWVLRSNGVTGQAPSLWMPATGFSLGTRFLSAHIAGSTHTGLLAVENVSSGLAVTQLASSGIGFSGKYRANIYSGLSPAFAKVIAGDVDGDGIDDLVVLQPHGENASIDVWGVKGGKTLGEPVHFATLKGTSYSDAMPALVRRGSKQTLVLFKRANVPLGNTYFTGGAPGLLAYDFNCGFRLEPVQDWGDLPGLFSEALWLNRLRQ